jgi:glucose-6-phosphate-specific signal transduction histidine kinase
MTGSTDSFSPLMVRLSAIAAETARLNARLTELSAEADDIKAALRVIERYAPLPEVGATPGEGVDKAAPSEKKKVTLPDAILEIVRDLDVFGGATARTILQQLDQRFDVNADSNSVRPTLWRMVQAGRLRRQGDYYVAPESNEAPIDVPKGAS